MLQYLGSCVSGFVPVNSGSQVVLGVPFLRAWHSQYSFDPTTGVARVGLASPVPTAPTMGKQAAPVAFAGRKLAGEVPAAANKKPAQQPLLFQASIPSARQRGLQ